jgi:hypothetical protein
MLRQIDGEGRNFCGPGLHVECIAELVQIAVVASLASLLKKKPRRQPRVRPEDAVPRERLGGDGTLEGTLNADGRSPQASDEDNRTDSRFGIRFSVN